jgi:CRISPR type IV-associated protein Csf3
MGPFELQIELRSPLILPNYPLSLDGLLYWALRDHMAHDQAMQALDGLLASQDGCFKASSMAFVRTPWQDVTAKVVAYGVCIDFEDNDLFVSNERRRSIVTNGGPFRKRQSRWDAYLAPAVAFHGVGNAEEIATLIRWSVAGLGKNHPRGAGQIGSVSVVDCEADLSWRDEEGRLARTLPVHLAAGAHGGSRGYARYRPRYDISEKVPCVIPNVFRSINREHFAA